MNEIQLLLFGPALPVSGEPVHCLVGQDAIHIRSDLEAHPQAVTLAALQATVAGFAHDRLQLSWQDGEQAAWSLMPAGAEEQERLLAALPHAPVAGLAQWRRSTRSQRWVWKGILYTFGAAALALALVLWQHDQVATWAASRVSLKTEEHIGDSVLKSLDPENNFLDDGEAVKAVREIGQRLTSGSRYHYRWYVAKDQAVNAFAIPGGIVVVNSGLLKRVDSPDELAAVLAHEVQHVEQRHALKNMLNSAAVATGMLLVLGDANAVVMMMAHQASTQYFNRQVESDADIGGVQLLQDRNIAAGGMVTFFRKMGESDDGGQAQESTSEVVGWFASHPDTQLRIQAIEEYLARHPCDTCRTLRWNKAALRAELDRLSDD